MWGQSAQLQGGEVKKKTKNKVCIIYGQRIPILTKKKTLNFLIQQVLIIFKMLRKHCYFIICEILSQRYMYSFKFENLTLCSSFSWQA